ncbi:MAG: hypothetical protein NBKEAIPA_01428 [Nitrospirae bacterium]|nr:hypothetical protein [Nitrospirota bacterium]MCE7965326.1 hypothetical protein [Nitrospira sp. NTP2]MEB2338899.1 hypothetical protein [Nitrospirales bacterium]QOJ34386.1 MAG: hypothetical protein HRU82_05215 [Nitrospira sp.]
MEITRWIGLAVCFGSLWAGPWEPAVAEALEPLVRPEAGASFEILAQDPLVEGVIERYLLDPRGEVEGLLLVDGTQLPVTSRAAAQLLHALRPGDRVRVRGRRHQAPPVVQPDLIENLSRGTTFAVPLRLDLPMRPQEQELSVRELTANGSVRVLLFHPLKGIVQGLLLSDGTQVRLPPDASPTLRNSFREGQRLAVRGNGTENRYGRALEAVAMGYDAARLVPLEPSLDRLPSPIP